MRRAASSFLLVILAACGDLELVDDQTVATADLLFLALQPAGQSLSPVPATVLNNAESWVRVLHADQFRTVYLEVRFPSGSLESLDGQALGVSDSVRVTLEPEDEGYGVTLSPSGLDLNQSALPYATFRFASYGDFSVADGSARYESRAAYANALTLWYEATPGRWERVVGSTFTGSDAVSGPLRHSGTYVVAAPR